MQQSPASAGSCSCFTVLVAFFQKGISFRAHLASWVVVLPGPSGLQDLTPTYNAIQTIPSIFLQSQDVLLPGQPPGIANSLPGINSDLKQSQLAHMLDSTQQTPRRASLRLSGWLSCSHTLFSQGQFITCFHDMKSCLWSHNKSNSLWRQKYVFLEVPPSLKCFVTLRCSELASGWLHTVLIDELRKSITMCSSHQQNSHKNSMGIIFKGDSWKII